MLPRAARSSAPRGRTRTSSTAASSGCAGTSRASTRSSRSAGRTRWELPRSSTTRTSLPIVGVPKTIDNDLSGTDYTFGFDTAVCICTEAIDRLHTTAESHNRVMVVEAMGRHAGWIALMSGIAGGADLILIPEHPVDLDEVAGPRPAPPPRQELLDRRRQRGCELPGVEDRARSTSSATSGSRSEASARRWPADRGAHRLRGAGDRSRPRPAWRHPTPRDRVLASASALRRPSWSTRVSSVGWRRCTATTSSRSANEATAELKLVPDDWYEVARRVLRLDALGGAWPTSPATEPAGDEHGVHACALERQHLVARENGDVGDRELAGGHVR